jgi:hypothetical protein
MAKLYTVNVHIGGIVQVQVSASNEDDAEHLGMTKASQLLQDKKISTYDLNVIDAEVLEVALDIKEVEKMLQDIKLKIRKNND